MKLRLLLLPLLLLSFAAIANAAPPAPKDGAGLAANANPPAGACGSSPHCVVLTWTASASAATDATIGYNIFRGTTAGGESSTPLNSGLAAVNCPTSGPCSFTDLTATVEGQKYFYTVAAASPSRPSSTQSAEVSGTIPFTTAPAPPTNVTVTAN